LSTETHAYNVRVILTVQNQSSVENIKELKTYKKTLRATRDNLRTISLEWESIEKDTHVNYIIEYKCTWQNTSITNVKVTNETKTKIENVTTSDCIIKLWCNFTDKAQLIDNTSVEPPGLAETPKTKQEKPANLVNDKFNYFRSNVTTTSINYATTVTPGNKGGSKYLGSKITVNPTKLITKNEIISSSLRPKSGSHKTVPDETNDSEDDLANNGTLIVIIILIVILCLMVTLVGTLYYFKRCHQKNNNDNKIDSREEIMLMPVPSQESQANIKIESLENYLKKTMVSSRNIENQFFLQLSKKRDIYASLSSRKVCHF
jgi:hypothetical protein